MGVFRIRKRGAGREFLGAVKRAAFDLIAGVARAFQSLALGLETVGAVIMFVIVTLVWT